MTSPEPATIHILMKAEYGSRYALPEEQSSLKGNPDSYFLTREAALAAMRARTPTGMLPMDGYVKTFGNDGLDRPTAVVYWNEQKSEGRGWWVVSDVLKGDHGYEGQVVLEFIHRLTGETTRR